MGAVVVERPAAAEARGRARRPRRGLVRLGPRETRLQESFGRSTKSLGKRVLFDIDDLVFDDRYTHLVMETLAQPVGEESLQAWFGWIARAGCTMRLCDGVITTNTFLAEKIRDFSGLPTWTIPNFLNRAQIDLSSRIRAAKQHSEWARDGHVDIGYFSGTPTHTRDFALIEPALVTLLESNPAVRLRIVGFPPQSELLAPLSHRIEILLLDEGLGTADAEFTARANRRLKEFMSSAGILILASHGDSLLREQCTEAVLLRAGAVEASGSMDSVLSTYHANLALESAAQPKFSDTASEDRR